MVIPPAMDWFGRPNPYIGISMAFLYSTCCILFYNEPKYFKMIQDVYFVVFDKLFTMAEIFQPTTHYFLLNLKNGDLERYPL